MLGQVELCPQFHHRHEQRGQKPHESNYEERHKLRFETNKAAVILWDCAVYARKASVAVSFGESSPDRYRSDGRISIT